MSKSEKSLYPAGQVFAVEFVRQFEYRETWVDLVDVASGTLIANRWEANYGTTTVLCSNDNLDHFGLAFYDKGGELIVFSNRELKVRT